MKHATHILGLFLLFCGCYNKQRNLAENTVTVHLGFKTKGLHPVNDNDAARAWIFDYTQRSLLETDMRTGGYLPALLTGMPLAHPDGKGFTFTLRPGITWDNGAPLTAADVVFSLKILVCPLVNNPSYKATFTGIFKDVYADSLNPQAVVVKTSGFHRSNLSIFTEAVIIQQSQWDPQKLLDQYTMPQFLDHAFAPQPALVNWAQKFNSPANATQLENLTGLGPYKITSWEPDSYLVLEKKQNWWGRNDTSIMNRAYPGKIIFKIIEDESSAYFAIKNQQVDASNKITTGKLLKLRKHAYFNAAYDSYFIDQYAYTYIGLNTKPDGIRHKPLFTSRRVRRAMAHLVPVNDLLNIFNKGQGRRMVSCVYPGKAGHNNTLTPIEYDVAKAIALLEEEGWRDTDGNNIRDKVINGEKIQFSFKLNYLNAVPGQKEMCLLIKDCMYNAGIEAIPNALEFAQFYQECYNQTFDAELGAWLSSSGHEDFTQLFSTASWANHGENFCGFGNAHSDSLIDACNRTQNEADYRRMLNEFQQIVYDEQPYIFLLSPKNKVILHKRFTGKVYTHKPNFYLNALKLNAAHGKGYKPTAL